MPERKYSRDPQRFDCFGLDLNRPVDSVKSSKWPFLKNVRSFQAGRIEPRDGLTNINTVVTSQTPVHSCRRLNDLTGGSTPAYARIVGTGTHLAYGTTSFTDTIGSDPVYSGNPL